MIKKALRTLILVATLCLALPLFSQEKKEGGALPRSTPSAENVNTDDIDNYLNAVKESGQELQADLNLIWKYLLPALSEPLPGKGLSQFDFFYAGEAKEQNMYIVKNGAIAWEYKGPKDKGEISDAVLMSNGNILFAHQFGVTLITQKKEVLWNHDAPKGSEIHTAQPIGKDLVVFIQGGDTARVFVVNAKTNKTMHSFIIPTKMPPSVHGQFRHARLTSSGTYLVAHMDLGKVCEYDVNGKELFTFNAPGIWSVESLKNGNMLICCRSQVIEVNRKGETIWDVQLKDLTGYNINSPQIAKRRPNGNTIINNWFNQWNGTVDLNNPPIQALEVTPDKKVVWALRSWVAPAALGPSTTIQILNEKGITEKVKFGKFK